MRQRSNLIIVFGIAFFLVGGAIVFLVLNDDDGSSGSSSSGNPATARLVTVFSATEDIPANTFGADVIERGLLETKQVPEANAPAGAITSAAILQDRIIATTIGAGDVITESNLLIRSLSQIPVPEGFEAVPVSVAFVDGGAGYIAPGDRVNVYGLFGLPENTTAGALNPADDPSNNFPRTELLITNVLVLDASQQAATTAAQASQAGSTSVARSVPTTQITLLLAMRSGDAERLMQVDQFGAGLRFTLVSDEAPPAGDTSGVDGTNVLDPVSAASAEPNG